MPSSDRDGDLPPQWRAMLGRVVSALAAAAADAERRGAALEQLMQPPPPATDLEQGLAGFRERLRGLHEQVARAEAAVAEADTVLAASEEALREWLHAAGAVRGKLASRAVRE
jgi:hypothetical protein